jgi:hypothetical protein
MSLFDNRNAYNPVVTFDGQQLSVTRLQTSLRPGEPLEIMVTGFLISSPQPISSEPVSSGLPVPESFRQPRLVMIRDGATAADAV